MAQLQDFKTFFERQAHLLVNPGPETYQLQSHQAPMQVSVPFFVAHFYSLWLKANRDF